MNRIQRKRTKGWKKPEGAVYIGYRTPYGNPFKWKDLPGGKGEAVDLYRQWLPEAVASGKINLAPLQGKTLMCFCREDEVCHGDVIISFMNKLPEL
jgi:hypothetical protein